MMASIYDDEQVQRCVKEVKDFYLGLTLDLLQETFARINLEELDWFYAKHASYLDVVNHTNELHQIKYKVYKRKTYPTISDALLDGTSCSGLKDGNQVVYFRYPTSSKQTYYYHCHFFIDDYQICCKLDKDLTTIMSLISVLKIIQLDESTALTVNVAGDNGERSRLEMTDYVDGYKVKTITSSNDEMYFNKYRHKINSVNFYEHKEGQLKRIYFIGKSGSEINIYFNKKL